jgi:hypothetical protein
MPDPEGYVRIEPIGQSRVDKKGTTAMFTKWVRKGARSLAVVAAVGLAALLTVAPAEAQAGSGGGNSGKGGVGSGSGNGSNGHRGDSGNHRGDHDGHRGEYGGYRGNFGGFGWGGDFPGYGFPYYGGQFGFGEGYPFDRYREFNRPPFHDGHGPVVTPHGVRR